MAHRIIKFVAKPYIASAGLVLGSAAVGFGALALVERENPELKVSRKVAEVEEAALARSGAEYANVDDAVARQNVALAEMLRGLKHKSFREKVEAAVDAQGRVSNEQIELCFGGGCVKRSVMVVVVIDGRWGCVRQLWRG